MSSYIWAGKKERVQAARKHVKEMKEEYQDEISRSVEESKIYPNINTYYTTRMSYKNEPITVTVLPADTVSALIMQNPQVKRAVLNFASFKHPGGMFLQGSAAQEESLCHESTLFNVLKEFKKEYYNINAKNPNYNLYNNNLLYSPNVLFKRGDEIQYADVITSAAPNFKAYNKYSNKKFDTDFINNLIKSRIRCILNSAWTNQVNTIILGAWGCGVFGNSPENIAKLFHEVMKEYFHDNCSIRHYIFAIPYDENSANYIAKHNFESFNNEFKQ